MALSIVRITALTSSSISVLFTDNIDPDIGIANISISSLVDSVNDPEIISVAVDGAIVTTSFRPIFTKIQYSVSFISTDNQAFISVNGDRISEDGNRNKLFITSPGEESSEIRDSILDNISKNTYELDEDSLARVMISSIADQIQTGKDVLDTVKSSNYISIEVKDQVMKRGTGPTDKFPHGGVFSVTRVGANITGATANFELEFNDTRYNSFITDKNSIVNSIIKSIPDDPINLKSLDVIDEVVSDNSDLPNYFDGMLIKVSNKPIMKLISLSLVRDNLIIPYDIERFGYSLKTISYDVNSASKNVTLDDNEIELSASSITGLSGGFLKPRPGDSLYVSYVYKKMGRSVDQASVELVEIKDAVRELVPAIVTKFTLKNAPIVTSADLIPSTGGVDFLNTQAYDGNPPFTTNHQAFKRELKFDLLRLPATSGEYSVNYNSGEVYVFGSGSFNDGTGSSPPVANYTYRKKYVDGLDYTFNKDTGDLAVKSSRNIAGIEAKIKFKYEDSFASEHDYKLSSHIEILNERVDNRLDGDFKIKTLNFPITNVFRILNETTGELYTPVRFNDSTVTFTGRKAPEQIDVTREHVNFTRVPQEVLYISDELLNSSNLKIYVIKLENGGIVDSNGRFVGANFSTSVMLSRTDIFISERFYEDMLFDDVSENIDRLTSIGDYSIDYNNGIIYVAVDDNSESDVGDISYMHKYMVVRNKHILDINNVYRSKSSTSENVINYSISDIGDANVYISNLESAGERFINNDPSRPIVVGTYQSGIDGITTSGINIFTSNSAVFTSNDVGRTLVIGSESSPPNQDVIISSIINDKQVLVDQPFSNTGKNVVWVILDTSEGSEKIITLAHDIVSVQNIYMVNQLGTVPASQLDGYYDIKNDIINGNTITLSDSNQLKVGDAVIVVYNYGNIFADYKYLKDEIVVSYEYGNNAIDWSISNSLNEEDEYYVTYKYGAMREALLTNFGALTQIKELSTFSSTMDREVYRSIVAGALQSFLKGPTIPSIEALVQSFTDVKPIIRESAFSNWVLGRDFLHPRTAFTAKSAEYDFGKFTNGIVINENQNVSVPALMHLKVNEGTIESWVRPNWNGLSNNAEITFNLQLDGYSDITESIFIGFSGSNPSTMPFTLNIYDSTTNVYGEPSNIDSDSGYFIWFDEFVNKWNIRWRHNNSVNHEFIGSISCTGEFYNITKPVNSDGYEINEITDTITSSINTVSFSAYIDGYESSQDDEGFSMDGITLCASNINYLFDMADKSSSNRMSIFKDGTGYLNFQVFDNMAKHSKNVGFYNLSTDIQHWKSNEIHHIAASWKFNSHDEKDEMHLFVDGNEVPALFKYGGNPKANSLYNFGNVAEEYIITSSINNIVGGFDGITESGSMLFRSVSVNFEDSGIQVGNTFRIIGDVPDGDGDPNFGLPYTVSGVGGNTLTVDRAFTSSMSSLQFSVNQVTDTVDTPVNFQDVIIVKRDSDGNETELIGVDGSNSDYTIRRGSNNSHVIVINNGVSSGDDVVVKPLGLLFRRCKSVIYSYGNTDIIRFNGPPPVTLGDVNITAIILPRTLISTGGGFGLVGTIIGAQLVTLLQSYFDNLCQPSNAINGRKLAIKLTGDNINYSIPGNQIIIVGETYSGATQEIIMFTENDTAVTTEYWTRIDNITASVIPIDATQAVGVIEIRENKPINVSENNGDFAEIVEYSNGLFRLEKYGYGGVAFSLNACSYEVDYPSFLKIKLDSQPDNFIIGSDFENNNNFDGVIDEFRILDFCSTDTRVGESIPSNLSTITTDFNEQDAFEADYNATTLLHFDNSLEDSFKFVDRFDSGFEVGPSVNTLFENAIRISDKNYILSNASSIFNNNEGTIEFWVSPLDDFNNNKDYNYYVDISSIINETQESISSINVILNQRARSIESVRLISDKYNTGKNYFTGGSISNIDNKTITLGNALPSNNTPVKVTYVPLNSQGDRISIFKDPNGSINFYMKASGIDHIISVPMAWTRHTWHRIMVMWKTNTVDNQDRLRLFVDGSERGTIRYGTGLLYGNGVIYGQAEVRAGVNRFLVDNIDLNDTFSNIFIGSSVYGLNNARALLDNIRFSDIERLQSIKYTSTDTVDVNYSSNLESVSPVMTDVSTTGLYDFNKSEEIIQFLSTIINAERGIFRFEIDVIDSFNKIINSSELKDLLIKVVNRLKPANSEAIITFSE